MAKIQESTENYLETILVLGLEGSSVRSVDIASELEYSRASVSVAMKNLRAAGYITIDENGYIFLTASGRDIAESMYERHTLLTDWLIFLGVDRNNAVQDACRMEHDMSKQSFDAIRNHIEHFKRDIYHNKSE